MQDLVTLAPAEPGIITMRCWPYLGSRAKCSPRSNTRARACARGVACKFNLTFTPVPPY